MDQTGLIWTLASVILMFISLDLCRIMHNKRWFRVVSCIIALNAGLAMFWLFCQILKLIKAGLINQ